MLSGHAFTRTRQAFRRAHLIVGIVLAVPLAVIGLTGSLLIALDTPAAPHRGVATAGGAPARPHDVGAIVGAAEAAAPSGYRSTLYVAGTRNAPARILLVAGGYGDRAAQAARPLQVLVDPITLAVVPAASGRRGLYAWVHRLHENALAGSVGRNVVGWLGVAMLVLALSGPFAWWPGRRHLREGVTVRRDGGRFRFWRDVHRTAGIGTFAFLLVVSVSGTFIIFPEPIGRAIAGVFPARPIWRTDVANVHAIPGIAAMTLDDAIALARATAGPGPVRSIGFARANQPLRVELAPAVAASAATVTVLIDPWRRRVVDTRDPRNYTFGERMVSSLRPLHEGHILGWPWRAALFVIGLCPVLFAITGTMMWALRKRRGVLLGARMAEV